MNDQDRKAIKQEVLAYLRANFIAVLATCRPDGHPHASTVYFWIDDDWKVFFMTRRSTRKFADIQVNPRIAMVVGAEFSPHTVQMQGTAVWLQEPEYMRDFLERMLAHKNIDHLYHGDFLPKNPFPQLKGEDYAMFRVDIDWLRWMDLSDDRKELHYHVVIPELAENVNAP